jgi:Protein of unknown function (DUF5674)
LSEPATREQVIEMLQANRFYIKTVVDIRKRILAGGGAMHSDCETILLERDSRQENIWGASWNPLAWTIVYESMVNLRPRQNRSMQILSAPIREQVQLVIHNLLGAYEQLE